MTAAYGTISRMDYFNRTNTVQALPASTANGNLLLWHMLTVIGGGAPASVTFPVGWTVLGSEQSGADSGGAGWKCQTAWRIAASEPASYTATHAATNSESLMIRVTGTGALSIDAFSQATQTGTGGGTTTATSVTTTATNDLLVFIALNWNDDSLTPPTGMTERQDAETTYLATETVAAAGATGNRTQTHPGSFPWYGNLYAIKDGPASYTVTAAAGTYSLTGFPPSLRKSGNYLSAATAGSYALTGSPVILANTGDAPDFPLYRSSSSNVYFARSDATNCNAPAGVANGDILIAAVWAGNAAGTAVIGITPPAGWTQVGSRTAVVDTGGYGVTFWVFWKRAAFEGSSYTFTHSGSAASYSTQVAIAAYSGCESSGNPVDAFSINSGTTGSASASAISTTIAGTKLLFLNQNWKESPTDPMSPPTGYTERVDQLVYLCDRDFTGPGSTGAVTQTVPGGPWSAVLLALKPDVPIYSTYRVNAVAGLYSLTGTTVVLGRGLFAVAGSYALTGSPVTLLKTAKTLTAAVGSYAFAGKPVTLTGGVPSPFTGAMSVWDGSAWVGKPAMVWDGSAWVEKPFRVWNGSAWI